MCSGPGTAHCIWSARYGTEPICAHRRDGKAEEKEEEELHLHENLWTPTWQVGKNKSDATLRQDVIKAHHHFLRLKPKSLLWQWHQEATTSVSAAPATPSRVLPQAFHWLFQAHLALPCRAFPSSDFYKYHLLMKRLGHPEEIIQKASGWTSMESRKIV